jgi:outer membrane protein
MPDYSSGLSVIVSLFPQMETIFKYINRAENLMKITHLLRVSALLLTFIFVLLLHNDPLFAVDSRVLLDSPPEDQLFDSAKNALLEKKYNEAGDQFRQFLEKYPQSKMAPEASKYYILCLPESQLFQSAKIKLNEKNYKKAEAEFQQFLSKYPNSRLAAAATIYIDVCNLEMSKQRPAASLQLDVTGKEVKVGNNSIKMVMKSPDTAPPVNKTEKHKSDTGILSVGTPASDLITFYQLALKNDPLFRSSEYESLATKETLRQAYAGFLPKLSSDLSYAITFQNVNSSDNTVYQAGSTDYDSKTYGVTFIQPIFRYSTFINLGQAKTVVNRSNMELEKARQDLALRVAEAYMDVLLAKDKLAAVKAEESAVNFHFVWAKERFEKGMAPITDRYDTEARLAAVGAQRIESENQLNDALQALTEICGVTPLDVQPLKEDIPFVKFAPEDVDQWMGTGLKQNLDVLIQKSKAEVADKEVERQKAAHYPTLDFEADFNNKDTKGSLFGGGSNTTNYDLIFKLNIPLYEGGLITSKTREAVNMLQSSLQGVTKQNRATERKVRSTYNGIISSIARAKAMKKSIEAQQLVVGAKEEGFKAGLYISLAVLDAMQDLYKYKKEYSQARNDYILNSLRLKHSVGSLTPEEINFVNSLFKTETDL